MNEIKIEDYICEKLSLDEQKIALDFVDYLEKEKFIFVKDNGYWKDKIYYLIKYKNEAICFIVIKDPEELENHWTAWSDDMDSKWLKEISEDEEIKKLAWKHVDLWGNCGSCSGGTRKVIFGKKFEKVCGCTFRIDNPNSEDLKFMKIMVQIRKKEIVK